MRITPDDENRTPPIMAPAPKVLFECRRCDNRHVIPWGEIAAHARDVPDGWAVIAIDRPPITVRAFLCGPCSTHVLNDVTAWRTAGTSEPGRNDEVA